MITTGSDSMLSEQQLSRARALFPHIAQGRIFLNHAGTSPLSTRVVSAVMAHLHARSGGDIDTYQNDLAMVGECKVFLGRLINAESPDRIALVPNTSDAINVVATGLLWKPGDRILLNDIEFPANVWPFLNLKRLGVVIDIVHSTDGRVTPDMVAARISPRTRLVALSAVQFLSGYRADLSLIGEMCRQRGIVFAVDGIQAVGAVRIDVQAMKIDALSAGCQKWQMAPQGTGFLYVTEELQSRLHQASLGWLAVEDPWDFYNYDQAPANTARRFEGGTRVMIGLWGLHEALMTLLEIGAGELEQQILSLTGVLIDQLRGVEGIEIVTPAPASERAGIVTIRLPSGVDQSAVLKRMADRKVIAALREGQLRFSPHFYCTAGEMATAAEVTRESLAQ